MFVERIRNLLKEKKIFAKDMLKELGINKDQLKRWEKPGAVIKPIHINAIANYFGVTPEYLLGKTEEKGSPSAELLKGLDELDLEVLTVFSQLSEHGREEALSFARFLAQRKNKDN